MPSRATTGWSTFALLIFLCGYFATSAIAQQPVEGTTLREFAVAIANAPSLRAAHERTEAARVRQASAGRISDLTVEGMYGRMQMPMEDGAMWSVALQQPLPKKGERAAERARAEADTSMNQAEVLMQTAEIATDIATALSEASAAEARVQLLETQLSRTRQVLAAVDARISSGRDTLTTRLLLQTRMTSLELMLERERLNGEDALVMARGILGLAPENSLPDFAAPEPEQISLDDVPALLIAQAKVQEGAAMARMARASVNPMTSIGVRFAREERSMGDEDTFGVAFMTELPWRARRYAASDEQAARAEQRAGELQSQSARHRAQAAVSTARRAQRLADTTLRLTGETRSRLEAEYESLVRSAGTSSMAGESSILMLLETLEKTTEADLQAIDAQAAARMARAQLWRFAPPALLLPASHPIP